MTTATFTCEHCGAVKEVEYDGCGSYSSMFNSGETRTILCRNPECRKVVGTITEY